MVGPEATDEAIEETESARLNRELNELMQELRVAQNGILIVVGFLLVIPFTQRFANVTDFQRIVYYLAFLTAGAAAVVIIAPVSYHRMVFRRHEKNALVIRGNHMMKLGLALLAVAILEVLVLVTDFLFWTWLAVAVGVLYVVLVGILWYLLPMESRRRRKAEARTSSGGEPRPAASAPPALGHASDGRR